MAVVLALSGAGCARTPSIAQIQTAHYAAAAIPPPAFQAPPSIANKSGYFELQAQATNLAGDPIPGLREADFVADVSGSRVPITFFRQNLRAPVPIGILVDTSGSMKPKIATVQLELAKFINGLGPSDEVFLIAFSSKPEVLHPTTTDHQAVVQKLSLLHAFGQTSIYDTIVLAAGEFGNGNHAPKTILLITDGMDNVSTVKEPDAISSLKANGISIYAIGIGDPNAAQWPGIALGPLIFGGAFDRVDAKALQDMARDAGGEAFIVPPMDKDGGKGFSNAINAISNTLDESYSIGVVLSPGISVSTLRLTIANHPNDIMTTHVINPTLP